MAKESAHWMRGSEISCRSWFWLVRMLMLLDSSPPRKRLPVREKSMPSVAGTLVTVWMAFSSCSGVSESLRRKLVGMR